MSRNIEINILGQKYTVKSDQDEAQLKEVASFVDARMGELVRGGRPASLGIAMIGALNIANEHFLYRREMEALLSQLEQRTARLQALLAEAGVTDDDPAKAP